MKFSNSIKHLAALPHVVRTHTDVREHSPLFFIFVIIIVSPGVRDKWRGYCDDRKQSLSIFDQR